MKFFSLPNRLQQHWLKYLFSSKQIAALTLSLLLPWLAEAALPTADDYCSLQNFQFRKETLWLNTTAPATQPSLFILHNCSHQTLWLNHPKRDSGAGAGWASVLDARHWSAILLQTPDFQMTCATQRPHGLAPVPCRKVLTVCTITSLSPSQTGNFWAAENQSSFRALWQRIQARHVLAD